MGNPLTAHEVFTPNEFPRYTYVVRGSAYETSLENYLRIGGTITVVSGPSKSGKTILVRRVVGDSNLLTVPCGGIETAEQLWERVLDRLAIPHATNHTSTRESATSIGAEIGTSQLFISGNNVAKVSLAWQQKNSKSSGSTANRRGQAQVTELLSRADVVLLLDDFHFIHRSAQSKIAEQLKAAAHDGVRIVLTVAAHRSDDLERATNQLTGRVANIDIAPWNRDELTEIALGGFPRLNIAGNILLPHELVGEAAGSPQLMQLLCLFTAIHAGFTVAAAEPKPLTLSDDDVNQIMTAATKLTQRRTVAQIMLNGPKPRGTVRDTFRLTDGTKGDVYYCILRALVSDPPRLDLGYDQIKTRVETLTKGNSPVGASITNALQQISDLTKEPTTKEPVADWDEDKRQFSIVDPYLWFYLRWSGFLLASRN